VNACDQRCRAALRPPELAGYVTGPGRRAPRFFVKPRLDKPSAKWRLASGPEILHAT
jgi:hypothetical protein